MASNIGVPRGGPQDRASVVATNILSAVFLHLRDHWVANVNPGLRGQIADMLREEFTDIAATAADEIRPQDE
jgi:hypothetical protein